MPKKSINQSLIKSYEIFKKYNSVPSHIDEQNNLISVFYPKGIRNTSLYDLPEKQRFSIAGRLLYDSYDRIKNLNDEELVILGNLYKLKISTKEEDIESLEERIFIQLENYPTDSMLDNTLEEVKNERKTIF